MTKEERQPGAGKGGPDRSPPPDQGQPPGHAGGTLGGGKAVDGT